jgi:hypothetical protein
MLQEEYFIQIVFLTKFYRPFTCIIFVGFALHRLGGLAGSKSFITGPSDTIVAFASLSWTWLDLAVDM